MDRVNDTFIREAAAIVSGTVRQEWPTIVQRALRAAPVQLGTFGIHHGSADHTFSAGVAAVMTRIGPAALHAYEGSEEAHDALPVAAVSLVQYVVVGLGLFVAAACMPALWEPRDRLVRALMVTLCAGVLLNALVTATLAAVRPRYQSRVVWLLPLVAAIAAQRVVAPQGCPAWQSAVG